MVSKDYSASVFRDLLSNRNYGRDDWLDLGVRLDHRQIGKVANGLGQVLGYPAPNHDPQSTVYFDRDPHRVSPNLISFGNAPR